MHAPQTPPSPRYPWLVLLGLCLGNCITNGFARFAYGLLLPAMKSDLGWSYSQAGWLNTAEGTQSWSARRGLLPKTVSANAWPSAIATGVRLMRSVTSPTA